MSVEHNHQPDQKTINRRWTAFFVSLAGIPLASFVYIYWTIAIDFQIAGLLEYTESKLMWSSVLGPALAIGPYMMWITTLLGGAILIHPLAKRILNGRWRAAGLRWDVLWILLFWVVRIPVPLEWSLFYFFAIKY